MIQTSKKELLAELDEHNDFFDMVVDMFPSQVYISGNPSSGNGAEKPVNTKYFKKAAEPAAQKMSRKTARNQEKRKKLDPATAESTTEIVHRQQQEQQQVPSDGSKPEESKDPHLPAATASGEKGSQGEPAVVAVVKPHHSRIEALRAKLQAKIALKQGSRPDSDPNQVSKRAARRAEKRKRQEEAKRVAKKGKSATTDKSTSYQMPEKSTASAAQDLAQVDFGRLTGLNPKKSSDPSTRDILQNLTKPKNLHKILADSQAKHKKLQELKEQGEDSKVAALHWKDAFKEADGTRIKDDPNKLKKVIKRKVVKKQKAQKAWKARTDQASAATQDRLKIRSHNLDARKQGGKLAANLSSKEIKKDDPKEKKGRAGFEGRKREFLNKEKKS
eukprot:CAMPEP_0198152470 /NCGR_PEP_ID=MMETSP1443-20131203/59950_1 /TAXON_ID=186043 /ORGANISM="Entomoneis sp., Strain CCMP2396" /LENGTH=387 /DNA_ID=CAMNT_0043818507 /DNA_START=52 /DNA_END=1212 /DNA_ORIENTATION=-